MHWRNHTGLADFALIVQLAARYQASAGWFSQCYEIALAIEDYAGAEDALVGYNESIDTSDELARIATSIYLSREDVYMSDLDEDEEIVTIWQREY